MKSVRLVVFLGLALGCTPRAGGGGGGFFDPDAAADDAAVASDLTSPEGDVVMGNDVSAPEDAPPAKDVPPAACTGDESCGAGRFCEQGVCRAQVCAPGTAACANATTIANCDPRGANRVEMACPGGAACAEGRCQSPRVCEPGASTCEGTSARRVCTPDGTATMTVSCASGERCTDGACVATQVCAPGSLSCGPDGQRRACNSAGTGYTSMPCGAAPNATVQCADGQCVASCSSGFGNCNGSASDGCEVGLLTAAANCGACGNACSAGQSCVSGACVGGGGANFRVTELRATGCAAVDHSTASGDDRGPIAAVSGYLLVSGDTRSVSINTATLGVSPLPLTLDWITSNLRTGELVVFSAGSTLLPANSGGTATHVVIVNPTTGVPSGAPIALSQGVRVTAGAGFFAGWDRAVVWDGTALWDVSLTSGAVRNLGPFTMPTYAPCELGGLWGIAETEGAETNLVFVANANTISRVRVSSRAVTNVATFTNLGDMCGISVLPSANRWYFHHEGPSQFRSGSVDEIAGWCDAVTSAGGGGVTCTAPEQLCGGACANVQSSAAHCGRCDNACATGQVCVGGSCQTSAGGYTRSSPTLAWLDACALPGVTRIFSTSQDDASQNFPLPFDNFLYWGRRVASVNVATNGFINLDGTALSGTAGSLPYADGSNAVVAPWWVDLRVPASSLCVATTGSVGARSFIAQWNNVNYYATSSAVLTFQVRLNEAGNTIEFLYNAMGAAPTTNFPAVGIENWDSTRAEVVCAGYNAMTPCTAVTTGSRFRFTPN